MRKLPPLLVAAGLGMLAGMRSMSAPALLSQHLAQHPDPYIAASPLRVLGSPAAATALRLLAVGELVADKLPLLPARTSSGSMFGRLASGGVAGAAVGLMHGQPVWKTAITGSLAAAASAHLAYQVRKQAGARTAIPDAFWGAAEDGLVLGAGTLLRQALERPIDE
jgi:uncharacterized membrane protein